MPLIPAPKKFNVKADSPSPIENFLIRTLFPQEGDEPDIPMNPVGAIAKGAFFKKLSQALREQAIDLRIKGVLSPREADSFYAEQVKSLQPLKSIKRKEFKDVYSVVGSTKRLRRKVDEDEFELLQRLRKPIDTEDESRLIQSRIEGTKELQEVFNDKYVRGFATGNYATSAITGKKEFRPVLSFVDNYEPQNTAGDTMSHEFLHARSRGARKRTGIWGSQDVVRTLPDKQTLRNASNTINTQMPNIEELFAEVGGAHITGNTAKLETLKAMGLEKQVNEIGAFVKSLLKKAK